MVSAFLKVVTGRRQGLNVPLSETEPTIIGRRRGDILLEDPLVSGSHAQLNFRDGVWHVLDLGSTNGTLVDGRLVREAALKPGAEITVGNTRMVLYIGLPEAEEPDGSRGRPDRSHLELAWLLDDELVELKPTGDHTRTPSDIIDQDLRLPPGMNAVAEVVAGQDNGKVYRFTRGNVTIGRRMGEVPLSDLEVSRRHAIIEVFGREMIFLRDLGSTNGTYHNGRRIHVSRLQNGDTVGIGRTVLKLQVTQ
ncbi:MAG: FHA domain-containing protein [Myxococcota bacterium]|jgi:pSer/pThr/pTyr-binding forkhead associated (FHA) protein|nr:FHA domain-containing protein [Myxococcota bacterium]